MAAARESTTSPPSEAPPSITEHVSRPSRVYRTGPCIVCGGEPSAAGRVRHHVIERHQAYNQEMLRYRNLLRASPPRLAACAYPPAPSGSKPLACKWGVRVHSSGEVTHHPI